jgi:hypothetical protein
MPKSTHRKIKQPQALASILPNLPNPQRAGMPAADSIIGMTVPTVAMASAVPGGAPLKQFTIIHTNEMDEYEKGASDPKKATIKAMAAAVPAGDNFGGKDRKAAKLSISSAALEKFKDVKSLINSLAAEDAMKNHQPKISRAQTSKRVKEEERNIRVPAFIYAASREDDNDFHLILGRNPTASPEMYMTMELSGLPPANSAAFTQLNAARDAFKKFFNDHAGGHLPRLAYDYYDPPIPVTIEGSLFFDVTHASGSRPGPKSLKSRMPVIWEVHPITKMVFKT